MAILNRRSSVASLATAMTTAAASQASGMEKSEHPDLIALSDQLPDALSA